MSNLTNQSVREAIEHYKQYKFIPQDMQGIVIEVAQQFLDRQEGFPEEKVYEGHEEIELGSYDEGFDYGQSKGEIIGFNEARSLCLSARNAEIAKARREIEDMKIISPTQRDLRDRILSLPIFKEVK